MRAARPHRGPQRAERAQLSLSRDYWDAYERFLANSETLVTQKGGCSMSQSAHYRQSAAAFSSRISRILATARPAAGTRLYIDKHGTRSRTQPFRGHDEQFKNYAVRRMHSIARVLALFGVLRDNNVSGARQRKPYRVEPAAALWQAFQGTGHTNACHTCPCLLFIDGHLPTVSTQNIRLRHALVVEFGDCVLMPRLVNEIDKYVDEGAGKDAFADAGALVLNEPAASWEEGLQFYRGRMRDLLGGGFDVLINHARGEALIFEDQMEQTRIDAVCAYYEGLYLTRVNTREVAQLVQSVS